MSLGERIKRRRIQLGMSVDELAEKVGKNRATIYRYEKGEIDDIPSSVLAALFGALQISPAELFEPQWDDTFLQNFNDQYCLKDVIRSRRLALGFTMKDLANKVGVSEGTVSRWESGEISSMRLDKVTALSNALGISPSFLVGCDNSPSHIFELSDDEISLLLAYRSASSEIKNAARAVLGADRR